MKDITEEKTDNYFFPSVKQDRFIQVFFPPSRSLHLHIKKASFPT